MKYQPANYAVLDQMVSDQSDTSCETRILN